MKDNKDLLKDVQQALAGNFELRNFLSNVRVLVNDGAVTIAGGVESNQLKQVAKKIINSVPGVNALIDRMRIEPVSRHRVDVEIDWTKGKMALSRY
jgi:osmotically-inducible protein OsmY